MASKKKMTMGVDRRRIAASSRTIWRRTGRQEMLQSLTETRDSMLSGSHTGTKQIRRRRDSSTKPKRCAELFRCKARASSMASSSRFPILATNTPSPIRFASPVFNVPVLIQATPDHSRQDGHHPSSRQFLRQNVRLQQSQAVRHSLFPHYASHRSARLSPNSPRISNGLPPFAVSSTDFRNLRIGALGARPTAFNTVRYSEKLLEASGISVETLDLSEVLGRISPHERQRRSRRSTNCNPCQQYVLHQQAFHQRRC